MGPNAAKIVLDDVVNSVRTHCHVAWRDFHTVRELVCEELSRLVPIRGQVTMAVAEEYKTDLVNDHEWMRDPNPKVFAWNLVNERLAAHPKKMEDTLRRFHVIVGTRPSNPDEIRELGFKLTQA